MSVKVEEEEEDRSASPFLKMTHCPTHLPQQPKLLYHPKAYTEEASHKITAASWKACY